MGDIKRCMHTSNIWSFSTTVYSFPPCKCTRTLRTCSLSERTLSFSMIDNLVNTCLKFVFHNHLSNLFYLAQVVNDFVCFFPIGLESTMFSIKCCFSYLQSASMPVPLHFQWMIVTGVCLPFLVYILIMMCHTAILRYVLCFIFLMQVNNNFLSVGNADKEIAVRVAYLSGYACCFERKEKMRFFGFKHDVTIIYWAILIYCGPRFSCILQLILSCWILLYYGLRYSCLCDFIEYLLILELYVC